MADFAGATRRAGNSNSFKAKRDRPDGQQENSKRRAEPEVAALNSYAKQYWAVESKSLKPYDEKIIEAIYDSELLPSKFDSKKVGALEFSQYLERYLWPNFKAETASRSHVLSIVLMVNQKFTEDSEAWQAFEDKPEEFEGFIDRVLAISLTPFDQLSISEQSFLIVFLIHAFQSLEKPFVRQQLLPLVSLGIWNHLIASRREKEFNVYPRLKNQWNSLQKKQSALEESAKTRLETKQAFLWNLLTQFFEALEITAASGEVDADARAYCERFIEFVIDLLTIMVTRRYFATLLDSSHLVVLCEMSVLRQRPEGRLFSQLIDMLRFYASFEINDFTGVELSDSEMVDKHYNFVTSMQRTAYESYESLKDFALSNVGSVDTRDSLREHLNGLSDETLHDFGAKLCLFPELPEGETSPYERALLMEVIVSHGQRRLSQIESLNEMPLYPTESMIWDENIVPSEYYTEGCLALPKLNLQFLTLHDYLLRNLNLFRLESTYEIRQDLEDAVMRLKPFEGESGNAVFSGWARMAQPITGFRIVEVGRAKIGERKPSSVRADIKIHLNTRPHIRQEWENLRKYDVCFLVSVRPPSNITQDLPFTEKFGIFAVRGCEIEGLLDDRGRLIDEQSDEQHKFKGDDRTIRVWLDCNQYHIDSTNMSSGAPNIYETFNIVVRRDPKENNFKAVLESIRDLMNSQCAVPEWLHDIFLGYGDVGTAHYSKLSKQYIPTLDYLDTFLDFEHLKASFPDRVVKAADDSATVAAPFKVTVPLPKADGTVDPIVATPYKPINRGPYPKDQAKMNTIRFTPTQIEAVRSGMQPGLTLVVGPPGTGKTDVAVQIISNIYHNFPEQRTLIVTHSNMALNQLFEKIMALDIKEHHLLRLGRGEESLATDKDFSRFGRVDSILQLRLDLLQEVDRLAQSMEGINGDVAYTCETAGLFYLYHVLATWEQYMTKVRNPALDVNSPEAITLISEQFPFHKYFADAPQPLFKGASYAEDLNIAQGCMRHVTNIFTSLKEIRPFELLTRQKDRSKYLLIKEARIIAMTCTHAALTRRDLIACAFKYDNVIMEESAQILEIETFIPLMLQHPQDGHSRLKRVILIGDHHQLPPVIKNMAFKKFSNMEQSLFTRFIRLNVPAIQLDAQGRARPTLSELYQWRYKNLGNLPHTKTLPEFQRANPGFQYDHQLIDVGDFNGVGEITPSIHYFQNLAEAEYVVAVYMYMRLLGYPANQITFLTTYNGQKDLLRDVAMAKCGSHPLFGMPDKIETVDKYQGSQNNYILLSLVRTKHVGHLRDVRRLIVAMSRARLGLYIFCRKSLFAKCVELSPAFKLLLKRPTQLRLYPQESYANTTRSVDDIAAPAFAVKDMPELAHYIYQRALLEIQQMTQGMQVMLPIPPKETQPSQPEEEEGEEEAPAAAATETATPAPQQAASEESSTKMDETVDAVPSSEAPKPAETTTVPAAAEPVATPVAAEPVAAPATSEPAAAEPAAAEPAAAEPAAAEPAPVAAVESQAEEAKPAAAKPSTPAKRKRGAEEPAAEPVTPAATPATPATPATSTKESTAGTPASKIEKMTVPELRAALGALGLATTGLKKELVQRYSEALNQ